MSIIPTVTYKIGDSITLLARPYIQLGWTDFDKKDGGWNKYKQPETGDAFYKLRLQGAYKADKLLATLFVDIPTGKAAVDKGGDNDIAHKGLRIKASGEYAIKGTLTATLALDFTNIGVDEKKSPTNKDVALTPTLGVKYTF
jgi:hypothetical protein